MKENKKFDHAFAIIRLDDPRQLTDLDLDEVFNWMQHYFTVKEIVFDADKAEQEVKRLNELNADKGCKYFYTITRIEHQFILKDFPPARTIDPNIKITDRDL